MFFCVILCFFFIFAFPIGDIPIVDSSVLVLLFLCVYFVLSNKYRYSFSKNFFNKKILKILSMIIFLILYSAFVTIMHEVYDFDIISTFVHQAISIIIGIMLYSYFKIKKYNILDIMVYTFWVQSIIQILSMINVDFRDFTNVFRHQETIIRGQYAYTGIRGLAISGSAFFGLAASYGLIFILWALERKNILEKKAVILKMIMLSMMIIGGISAGRTCIVGILIALIVLIYSIIKEKSSIEKNFFRNVLAILLMVILMSMIVLMYNNKIVQIEYFINYAGEFVRNLFNGKGLTSTSTTHLFSEMYFKIDLSTFIKGTGRYVNENGSYFMGTDAGYMRNILFFGVLGFLMLFILQTMYFYVNKKHGRFQRMVCLWYLAILHIKGETLGFLIMVESILVIYMFYMRDEYINKYRQIEEL